MAAARPQEQQLFQNAPQQLQAFREEQLYVILYLDQTYAAAKQYHKKVIDPGLDRSFGQMSVHDWPIYDGQDTSKARIVARARGHYIQTGVDGDQYWFNTNNIVFLKDSCEFNPSEVDDAMNKGKELGSGGYGTVYKAEMRGNIFAVKVPLKGSSQGEKEFKQEVEILKTTQHENLVTLVGACREKRALFYEYLPNGTLRNRLDDPSFSWEKRIQVAASICSALEFLHNIKPEPIAHGDLKPANILFDAKYVCKLSDFGISRQLKFSDDTTTPSHTTDVPKGSGAYKDPEFDRTGKLTPYSDVHALGIILLQLVTGRNNPYNLRKDVCDVLGDESKSVDELTEVICEEFVDTKLQLDARSKVDPVKMIQLGLRCSNDERKDRPKVADVWAEIEEMKSGGTSQDQGQPSSQ
ncbi:U-box domain-containing protein 33 [Dichanthelium oligosanthes]|uniref:Dirigent protein n=1 Tax=Dichanthelium oligosanthes TaxID=888268 RepID=A0A1E5UZI9_9POAL|nr:U-box domain-containing protein 33 [Dichanthelium oligosanthes]